MKGLKVTSDLVGDRRGVLPAGATAAPGAQLWGAQAGCGGCHTLAAVGSSGQVGPNLDVLRPSAARIAYQITYGGAVMPAFSGTLSAPEIQALASWVASVAGGRQPPPVREQRSFEQLGWLGCGRVTGPGCWTGRCVVGDDRRRGPSAPEQARAAGLLPPCRHRLLRSRHDRGGRGVPALGRLETRRNLGPAQRGCPEASARLTGRLIRQEPSLCSSSPSSFIAVVAPKPAQNALSGEVGVAAVGWPERACLAAVFCGIVVGVRVVDLTHPYDNGMPVFPGLPDPSFEPIAKVEDDGYAMTRYSMLNHIGTHVDAPAHQIVGGGHPR